MPVDGLCVMVSFAFSNSLDLGSWLVQGQPNQYHKYQSI